MPFSKNNQNEKKIRVIHVVSLIGVLLLLVFFLSKNTFGSHALEINEFMASNRVTITDEDGDYPDWIELYNSGSSTLELEGFWLSDDLLNPLKWQFPAISLEPGEFLLVFASGKNRKDPAGPYLHTNFRISAQGETLVLSTADGRIIDSIDTGEMYSNVSMGRKKGNRDKWVYYLDPTPGAENNTEGYPEILLPEKEDAPVYVNEFMTSNKTSILDEDGNLSDWIEIYNSGSEPINLDQYWLSDKIENPFKWRFPEVVIEAEEYLVVFASGKDQRDPEGIYLHTNFRLNDRDDVIMFSTPDGRLLDEIIIRDMVTDASYGRDQDNKDRWLYYPTPTPGEANYTQGFEYLSGKKLVDDHSLHINEAMALNLKTIADEDGDYPDWIEIYNSGDAPVNLEGYGLSDKPDNPFRWSFPDTTIEPGDYLLVFASGKDRASPESVRLHTNFKIHITGEPLVLTAPSGEVIDEMPTGKLLPDVSVGRHPDGETGRVFFTEPTPGAANLTSPLSAYAPEPIFSHRGGFYDDGFSLSLHLQSPPPGAVIHYTLNGREPTEDSPVYKEPIPIDKTTVVRARAFAEGRLPGRSVNHSFFIQENSTLTVVSIAMDPKDLWDPREGIYVKGYHASSEFPYLGANFWKDMEKPIHLQVFEPDGRLGFSFDAGIKIAGQYSRAMPQKSFNIFARNRYGYNVMEYPFFPGEPLTTFKAITLRTSGQDATLSKIRDSMMTSLLDITDLDYQLSHPANVFINGEYWGVYNIRERINKYFIAYNHDVDPENVDLLQGNSIVRAGSNEEYLALRDFVSRNDMRVTENYEYVKTQMDVESFIDFWVAQIYFANTDSANIRFWKERSPEGKWRWIVYDLDWGFFNVNHNTLYYVTNPEGTGIGRHLSTALLVNLLKNEEFKNLFIERMAHHLNNTFETERVLAVIDKFAGAIEPEMHRHLARWGGTVSGWNSQVQRLRNFAEKRQAIILPHIRRKFNLTNEEMKMFDAWN